MPQSLAQVYLHLVFSTKNRAAFLSDKSVREQLHAYLAGTCDNLESPSLKVGGMEDHVHILCRFGRKMSIADSVRELKRESSKWMTREHCLVNFEWQAGYGAFSVNPSHADALISYIGNQEEHHRQESFQDEFRRLLRKYGIEYDERYVWD
jgi:REP-associated tyrosine transposase